MSERGNEVREKIFSIFISTKINRNVERKNKTQKGGKKLTEGGGRMGAYSFLLSLGDKREI